jgi:teichoic acid transport system permease protein
MRLSMKLARQIWYIAQSSLMRRYAGARLGVLWAVLQPALVFGVFWFVSVYGLRMGGGDGPPYYAILFCGLLPWMALSSAVSESASVLHAQRHLLNARVLPSQALPVAVALEQGIVHVFLLAVVAAIFMANGLGPYASWIGLLYWATCLLALALATGLVISVLTAGSEDATQSVSFLLLIWFWGSPIVWRPDTMPAKHLLWLEINPFYYVIEGYRSALLSGHGFAPGIASTALFWIEVALVALTGAVLHRVFRSRIPEWIQ